MIETKLQTQKGCALQEMSLQQGSLKAFEYNSAPFIDLATQYCELFNQEPSGIFDEGRKIFGTLRLQLKKIPHMDVEFFAQSDPDNKSSGKAIHSAAITLRHGDLALQIKDLCGKDTPGVVTELLLKAKSEGIGHLILDIPGRQREPVLKALSLTEPEVLSQYPLILKISGNHPGLVSREEFLKEPGATEIDVVSSVMQQAMRRLSLSVAEMDLLLNKLKPRVS